MNIKYWVNKWLNGGLWWQLLFFAIVNILAFGLCVLVYFRIGIDEKVGLWEALRLFVNSNGVIEHTYPWFHRTQHPIVIYRVFRNNSILKSHCLNHYQCHQFEGR